MQPLLLWKSNDQYTTWACVCSLGYPAHNAHAPYCHLWPAPLYNIFPHYLTNGTIFEKKRKNLQNTKCVFWFTLRLLSETFLILRRNERDTNVPAICRILRKPEILRQILGKSWSNEFHENRSSGRRTVPCERSDRYDEDSSRSPQFCKRAHRVQWKQSNSVHRQLYVRTHVTSSRRTTWSACHLKLIERTNKMQPCSRIYYSNVS